MAKCYRKKSTRTPEQQGSWKKKEDRSSKHIHSWCFCSVVNVNKLVCTRSRQCEYSCTGWILSCRIRTIWKQCNTCRYLSLFCEILSDYISWFFYGFHQVCFLKCVVTNEGWKSFDVLRSYQSVPLLTNCLHVSMTTWPSTSNLPGHIPAVSLCCYFSHNALIWQVSEKKNVGKVKNIY